MAFFHICNDDGFRFQCSGVSILAAGFSLLASGDWLFLNVTRIGFASCQEPEASSQGVA
jgi:hypothetical protein